MLAQRAAIPMWLESRVGVERARLGRDGVLRGEGVPRGEGQPILLIPGFLAGDASLALMGRWLRDLGYRPCRARIRANVDCTERALVRLERQLEEASERHGQPVTIIGHSRGGVMARLLAVRRPELVAGIACLGSPLKDQFAVHPLVRLQIRAVAALGSLGLGGLFSNDCRDGGCCEEVRRQAEQPLPPQLPFLSVFSRTDGIVDWRSCLDAQAETVEARASHVGMAVSAPVYRILGEWLPGAVPAATAAPQRLRLAHAA
jgi:triacylglycerol lipase